jgi:hypothetical protein
LRDYFALQLIIPKSFLQSQFHFFKKNGDHFLDYFFKILKTQQLKNQIINSFFLSLYVNLNTF